MSIDVVRFDDADLDDWNRLLERSPHATPFHLPEALRVVADHANATLHPLVGYKGEQPVGLFPVFEQRRGPLTLAFSPPPDLKVDYLGPALLDVDQLNRRRLDKRNRRFFDACVEWLDAEVDPRYVNVRTGFRYEDPRPFVWQDFDVNTKYTYVLDLAAGADAIFEAFSGDARRKIRQARKTDHEVTVRVGGVDDARRIIEHLHERLSSQGVTDPVPLSFVLDLHERLPPGTVRPYACLLDGAFHGGIVALESHGTVYAWQGGAKTEGDLDLNDFVDWHIIRDAIDRGNRRYDLVGAESPRLCWYKAKFAPDIQPYHVVQRSSRTMDTLATAYKALR